ncbi:hypothetical protein BDR03DRAFT_1013548 [Suillus americanus]|nr:hypothetical protein BDR03DRAFT_1013548 [Suillus americanus]
MTVFLAQWAELEHDSSKVDAFVRCINWKIVTFANHIINLTVYADATKGFVNEDGEIICGRDGPVDAMQGLRGRGTTVVVLSAGTNSREYDSSNNMDVEMEVKVDESSEEVDMAT